MKWEKENKKNISVDEYCVDYVQFVTFSKHNATYDYTLLRELFIYLDVHDIT